MSWSATAESFEGWGVAAATRAISYGSSPKQRRDIRCFVVIQTNPNIKRATHFTAPTEESHG